MGDHVDINHNLSSLAIYYSKDLPVGTILFDKGCLTLSIQTVSFMLCESHIFSKIIIRVFQIHVIRNSTSY